MRKTAEMTITEREKTMKEGFPGRREAALTPSRKAHCAGGLFHRLHARLVLWALVLLLGLPPHALCSGYHPPFDRAVKEATWIISNVVLSEHEPLKVLKGITEKPSLLGRVYRVRVEKCFRGPFKKGDELLIWDPYYRSTAGYYLDTKGPNLSFLKSPGERGGGREWYGSKAAPKDATLKLGLPIRNLSAGPSRGRGTGQKAWERLLELTQVGQRMVPEKDARAALAEDPGDAVLVNYLLKHWSAWAAEDGDLVRSAVERHKDNPTTVNLASTLLRKHGEGLDARLLERLFRTAAPRGRASLMAHVDAESVDVLAPLLTSWIEADEEGGGEAIACLARLAPATLKQQLCKKRLPFWLEIPALKALDMRPVDVGPAYAADYDEAAMKLEDWELRQARDLAQGNTFGVTYGFKTKQEVWPRLLPLLVRQQQFLPPKAREAAIAMARSWGYEVTRDAKSARVGARKGPPVEVQLSLVKGEDQVRVVVRTKRPVLIAKPNGREVRVCDPSGRVKSSLTSGGHDYGQPDTPRTQFVLMEAGKVIHETTEDYSGLLKSVRKGAPKGPYRVRVAVVYGSSGVNHDLDAWTGMVYSEELEIR